MPKHNKPREIVVQGASIRIVSHQQDDFICLTDMVSNFEGGSALIEQWLRNKNTLAFLATWERLNNPMFNSLEFDEISKQAGLNSFYLSVKKWTQSTNAIGIQAKAGRYGATFAHKDIAFEFGTWLSPEFKLYLITEFQRLKAAEVHTNDSVWDLHRTLAKVNYRIHTDAIKAYIIPKKLQQGVLSSYIYASEADILNLAVFGKTAKEWRDENPDKRGNVRDHATIEQLLVVANLESLNAFFISQGMPIENRLELLNETAIMQMKTLLTNPLKGSINTLT